MKKPELCCRSTFTVFVATGLLLATSASAGEHHHKHGSHSDKMVHMMDGNQDGKVTRDEHATAAKKMFEKMDANKDGQVLEAEMTDHHQQVMGKHEGKDLKEMSSAEKIRAVDANEDGALTAEEHAAASKRMFGKMDQDQDGVLTAAEIDAGHKKMMSSSSAHDH